MMPLVDTVERVGAHALERFGGERDTIEAFVGQLRRAAAEGQLDDLTAMLLRFEDYLEALLVEPRRR
jgi:hypothetical protein